MEREAFADFRRRLDPSAAVPNPRAEALEAGEPVVFHGWELARFVPGLEMSGNYRVEPDGALTEVAAVTGEGFGRIRWEPVD